jgi:hypothetical protein
MEQRPREAGTQLVKKLPTFYGTWRFIVNKICHCTFSWTRWIQSTILYPLVFITVLHWVLLYSHHCSSVLIKQFQFTILGRKLHPCHKTNFCNAGGKVCFLFLCSLYNDRLSITWSYKAWNYRVMNNELERMGKKGIMA